MIPSRTLATSLASYISGIVTFLVHGAILTHISPIAFIAVDAAGLGALLVGSAAWVGIAFAVYWPTFYLLGRYTFGPVRILSAAAATLILGATLATIVLFRLRHPINLETMRRAWNVYLYFGIASLVLLAGAGWSRVWPAPADEPRIARSTAG